ILPASLHAAVAAAFPTTGGPKTFHHSAARTLTGGDFRNAYTPPHATPPSGSDTATSQATVATLQLSTFNSSDLTSYASEHQYPAAKNPSIVALSTSWGMCEAGTGRSLILAYEPIIAALNAVGVTVFASSGDFGIYDCGDPSGTGFGNSQPDVDYPASSPRVV